ncbi:methionyl-tRNA formyltransferase [Bacteroidia bacterium]|nr:methionyl-tRNA formyltransferase [Bacteroidia bacterium]MDC1394980.1 methionyl-tRNA formyltransferase [Bacteroidia bacterium]
MPRNKKDLQIIFLGNPEFARYHLERIISEGFNVVAVISAPDRPAGRGMKLFSTPVTTYAREQNIPCLQPKNLKNTDFLAELKSYNADLQIVIAFRMLPLVVWDMPELGTFNLHASLLPQYRGAAPINWAIINGETKTGVSTFKLKHEIDTGNLLVQSTCEITQTDTAGTLHDKLMHLGANAIIETLNQVVSEKIIEIPQDESQVSKPAPKLFTENTEINWSNNGKSIVNLVRGLSPFPTAHKVFDNKMLKLYGVRFEETVHSNYLGEHVSDGKNYLGVYVKDGIIYLEDIKLQGKRQMMIKDFLNGYDLSHLRLKSVL